MRWTVPFFYFLPTAAPLPIHRSVDPFFSVRLSRSLSFRATDLLRVLLGVACVVKVRLRSDPASFLLFFPFAGLLLF